MKPIARIPYKHMNWVWVSDHYDIHLSGLCKLNGRLCRFETNYPAGFRSKIRCRVYELTLMQRILWLAQKRLFEICVGRHWTYPDRRQGVRYTGGFPGLRRLYYKLPKLNAS